MKVDRESPSFEGEKGKTYFTKIEKKNLQVCWLDKK